MIPVAIVAFLGLIVVTVAGAITALLSSRSTMPRWALLVAGIPALSIGAFYTFGLAIAQLHHSQCKLSSG